MIAVWNGKDDDNAKSIHSCAGEFQSHDDDNDGDTDIVSHMPNAPNAALAYSLPDSK